MLSLSALTLNQIGTLSMATLAVMPFDYAGPVYSVQLMAVDAYTTNRRTAAIAFTTTQTTGHHGSTNAAQATKDQA